MDRVAIKPAVMDLAAIQRVVMDLAGMEPVVTEGAVITILTPPDRQGPTLNRRTGNSDEDALGPKQVLMLTKAPVAPFCVAHGAQSRGGFASK
jgi:hypothetical protein